MKKRIFVFVVIGQKEHIDELNLSIRTLKHFTSYEIIVVTDLARNESGIEHGNILDVSTPESMTNHQAAIYLKTGLHRFLDMSHEYCYLDGDVLAVRKNVDDVFNHFIAPIIFCTDHCRLQEFSEAAIHSTFDPDILKKREVLYSLFDTINQKRRRKRSPIKTFFERFIQFILFRLSIVIVTALTMMKGTEIKKHKSKSANQKRKFQYNEQIRNTFVRLNEKIYRNPSAPVYYFLREGFFHDRVNFRWTDARGNIILLEKSDYLADRIRQKFNVDVKEKNWQHWNGGVFLFNSESVEFMENWHQWTLEIFKDKNWQVRDQGTLVATVWKFNLEHHPTLPIEFNFIADYHHPTMKYLGNLTFGFAKKRIIFRPVFLHIYHHWGDTEWAVWKDVKHFLNTMN